jgi:hypothetical protein
MTSAIELRAFTTGDCGPSLATVPADLHDTARRLAQKTAQSVVVDLFQPSHQSWFAHGRGPSARDENVRISEALNSLGPAIS